MGTRQDIFNAVELAAKAKAEYEASKKANPGFVGVAPDMFKGMSTDPEVMAPKGPASGQQEEFAQFVAKLNKLYAEHPQYYQQHLAEIAKQARGEKDNIRSRYLQEWPGMGMDIPSPIPGLSRQDVEGIQPREVLPMDDWQNGEPQFNFKSIPQKGGIIEQLLKQIR